MQLVKSCDFGKKRPVSAKIPASACQNFDYSRGNLTFLMRLKLFRLNPCIPPNQLMAGAAKLSSPCFPPFIRAHAPE